jgi:hypothetical protein
MRAHAAVLVLALMLSPLAAAACELRCSRPTASQPVNAHASCHDAGSERRQTLHSQPRHCGDHHSDGVMVGVEIGVAVPVRGLHSVYAVARVYPRPPSTVLHLCRPPGIRSIVHAAASSPPLRI